MKSKSITKKKRPKYVLKKAWETRRKNAESTKMFSSFKAALKSEAASPVQATPTSETETRHSEANGPNPAYDPQAEIAEIKRDYLDRQLCGFQGDFQVIQRQRHKTEATPIMLSWEQARAIYHFLLMEGYSPFGATRR